HWWEGKSEKAPWDEVQIEKDAGLSADNQDGWHDWKGGLIRFRDEASAGQPWAHPNGRITIPLKNIDNWVGKAGERPEEERPEHWDDPQGVPIGLTLTGGRRADTEPLARLVYNPNKDGKRG